MSRGRTLSTFSKLDTLDDYDAAQKYSEAVIIMSKSAEPTDIVWQNMKGKRGLFIFRRLFIFICCFLIIIFVSSPAVLFANLKQLDQSHFFDFTWTDHLPASEYW